MRELVVALITATIVIASLTLAACQAGPRRPTVTPVGTAGIGHPTQATMTSSTTPSEPEACTSGQLIYLRDAAAGSPASAFALDARTGHSERLFSVSEDIVDVSQANWWHRWAISPDGRWLAYAVENERLNYDVVVRRLTVDSGERRLSLGIASPTDFLWAADSSSLYYGVAHGHSVEWEIDSPLMELVVDDYEIHRMGLGQVLGTDTPPTITAVDSGELLARLDSDQIGGQIPGLLAYDPASGNAAVRLPAVLLEPDLGEPGSAQIIVVDGAVRDRGDVYSREVARVPASTEPFSWAASPDGQWLAFTRTWPGYEKPGIAALGLATGLKTYVGLWESSRPRLAWSREGTYLASNQRSGIDTSSWTGEQWNGTIWERVDTMGAIIAFAPDAPCMLTTTGMVMNVESAATRRQMDTLAVDWHSIADHVIGWAAAQSAAPHEP